MAEVLTFTENVYVAAWFGESTSAIKRRDELLDAIPLAVVQGVEVEGTTVYVIRVSVLDDGTELFLK